MLSAAEKRAGDNFSGYLQSLVARDLRNEPIDGLSENIMIELTTRLLGDRVATRLRPIVAGLDQRDELATLIESYISDHAERPRHSRTRTNV